MKNNAEIAVPGRITVRTRIVDYVTLTKPELTFLSVLTALCGFYLASDIFDVRSFIGVAIGTLFLGGGAGALNQYIERNFDSMMRRTERRPLPAGRILPGAALAYGITLSILGIVVLALFTNALSVTLGLATIVSYLFLYTPMKRRTAHATLLGAIPGALPPLIGWAAAANTISIGGWILFLVLFFWQMPHFLSLAWMYRKDYARAGYRMLTVLDAHGRRTSTHALLHTFLLVIASSFFVILGLTGTMYAIGAAVLGISFLFFSLSFKWFTGNESPAMAMKATQYSRYLFFASLLYLPALMFLMTVDKL